MRGWGATTQLRGIFIFNAFGKNPGIWGICCKDFPARIFEFLDMGKKIPAEPSVKNGGRDFCGVC
jgi:hypothetical protein